MKQRSAKMENYFVVGAKWGGEEKLHEFIDGGYWQMGIGQLWPTSAIAFGRAIERRSGANLSS
jgi:hypothetical protein